jgi:hypothetical protein
MDKTIQVTVIELFENLQLSLCVGFTLLMNNNCKDSGQGLTETKKRLMC